MALWFDAGGCAGGGGKRKKKEWVGVCANSAGKKVLGFAFSVMSLCFAAVWLQGSSLNLTRFCCVRDLGHA